MFLTSFLSIFMVAIATVQGCGYETCPKLEPNKLNIHVISHSHDDVGWLKTPDGYFDEDVKHVLDHVIQELGKNHKRRFVEVEQYYFYRWWLIQSKETQEKVKAFVKNGQLSFANGGWCVNDEAATHYTSIIDQMTLGINFIRNTFGECAVPKLSWQIDPFGASREMANLYTMMNFDGHILNRGSNLFGEFLWNTSDSGSQIFTSRLHAHYSAPGGFNFEDADEITEANKNEKAQKLVEIGKRWNDDYGKKGHVLMTFGDDFRYNHAQRWFSNIDKLIDTISQKHPDVHIFYSSPHCYIKAVKDAKVETKSNDYFPYWTGFFSSRPVVKSVERYVDGLLQAAKQLDVLAKLPDAQELLFEGKNELGILQHHDAITGTSKPNVMFDYKERLTNAIHALERVISRALGKLTAKQYNPANRSQFEPIVYTTANISSSTFELNSPNFAVIIYNSLIHPQSKYIRIPVSSSHGFSVRDFDGNEVKNVSLVPIGSQVNQLIGHNAKITHELVFQSQLPALGFNTYFVTFSSDKLKSEQLKADRDGNLALKANSSVFLIDSKTGQLKAIERNGKQHRVNQHFYYYPAKHGSTYEFCPSGGSVTLSGESKLVSAVKYSGFYEVQQKVNDWIHQTIRVYEDREFAEFDYVIGPVSEEPTIGKEVVTRFETDLITRNTWYTDANGRQNIRRVYDNRVHSCGGEKNTYTYNYYPITTRALIRDEASNLELSLQTDRAAGAASMAEGQLELMLHRRLFPGDSFIPLNDLDINDIGVVTRGHVLLLLNNLQGESVDNYRPLGPHMLMTPLVAFKAFSDVNHYKSEHVGKKSFVASVPPANVHLVTMENWGSLQNNEVLLRFENFFQTNDDSAKRLNRGSNISINEIFTKEAIESESFMETNLIVSNRTSSTGKVTLDAQAIKTFLIKVKRNIPAKKECSLKWEKLQNGQISSNALKVGRDADHVNDLFICRHKNVDNLPGKYGKHIACRVSYGGKETMFNDTNVEILAGNMNDVQWIPRHGGDALPLTAFVAGSKKDTGAPIYVARCSTHDSIQIGKVDEYFYYPFGLHENRDCPNHEVLIC